VTSGKGYDILRPIFEWPALSLPRDAANVTATLYIYITGRVGSPQNYTFKLCRCSRYDWGEMAVTYNQYKTGSNWTAPGGDFTTPEVSFAGPSATGWFSIVCDTIAADAVANRGGAFNVIMWENYPSVPTDNAFYFGSRDGDAGQRPYIRVTYDLGGMEEAMVWSD
jgi:hypothetical protein